MLRAALAVAVALPLLIACEAETPEDAPRPKALDLVPANAAAYTEVSLNPSEGQRRALDELASRLPGEARRALEERSRSAFDEALPPLDVDPADLEPWLGDTAAEFEVTEVIEDFHVYLFAVEDGAKDPEKTFVKGLEFTKKKSYRGVDYVSGRAIDGRISEVGVLEGFVVVAEKGGFAATVDASKSESLETVPEFRQAMDGVERDALASFYVDVGSLQNQSTLADQINRGELQSAGIYGNGVIGGSVSARPDALVVETSSGFDKGGLLAPVLRAYRRDETLSDLPGHAWFAARIPKVKAIARAAMTLTGARQKAGWRAFRRGLKRAGLSFRKDFLSWMRGATLYVGGRFPKLDVGLSIQSSNPRRTAELVRFLEVALRAGGVRVGEAPSFARDADFALRVRRLPDPLYVSGARAFSITYGRPLNLVLREEGFLDASDLFTESMEALDDRYGVTLFVDGDQALGFVEDTVEVSSGLLPEAYVDEVRPYLAQGDYLVHGVAVEGDRILQQMVIGVR